MDRKDVVALVLALLTLALPAAVLATHPPQQPIPIHWNATGEADRFVPPEQAPLLLLLAAVLILIVWGVRYVYPLKRNVERFRGAYNAFVIALGAALSAILASSFLGWSQTVFIAVGALLVAAGAVMFVSERNWAIGFRTPWTLSDDRIWRVANREAGAVTAIAGLALALAPLFGEPLLPIVVFLLAGYATVTVHAYLLWRKGAKE